MNRVTVGGKFSNFFLTAGAPASALPADKLHFEPQRRDVVRPPGLGRPGGAHVVCRVAAAASAAADAARIALLPEVESVAAQLVVPVYAAPERPLMLTLVLVLLVLVLVRRRRQAGRAVIVRHQLMPVVVVAAAASAAARLVPVAAAPVLLLLQGGSRKGPAVLARRCAAGRGRSRSHSSSRSGSINIGINGSSSSSSSDGSDSSVGMRRDAGVERRLRQAPALEELVVQRVLVLLRLVPEVARAPKGP